MLSRSSALIRDEVSVGVPMQGDAVEIYIMTKEGTKREVMPLKKD